MLTTLLLLAMGGLSIVGRLEGAMDSDGSELGDKLGLKLGIIDGAMDGDKDGLELGA